MWADANDLAKSPDINFKGTDSKWDFWRKMRRIVTIKRNPSSEQSISLGVQNRTSPKVEDVNLNGVEKQSVVTPSDKYKRTVTVSNVSLSAKVNTPTSDLNRALSNFPEVHLRLENKPAKEGYHDSSACAGSHHWVHSLHESGHNAKKLNLIQDFSQATFDSHSHFLRECENPLAAVEQVTGKKIIEQNRTDIAELTGDHALSSTPAQTTEETRKLTLPVLHNGCTYGKSFKMSQSVSCGFKKVGSEELCSKSESVSFENSCTTMVTCELQQKRKITKCVEVKENVQHKPYEQPNRKRVEGSQSQIKEYPKLPDSNIGCQMLRKMGWSGGGLGPEGNRGREEPVMASVFRKRQGLGMPVEVPTKKKKKNTTEPQFSTSINKKTIQKFVKNNLQKELQYSKPLTANQHAVVQKLCKESGLEYIDQPVGVVIRKPYHLPTMQLVNIAQKTHEEIKVRKKKIMENSTKPNFSRHINKTTIKKFVNDNLQRELQYEYTLTTKQHAIVRQLCKVNGLDCIDLPVGVAIRKPHHLPKKVLVCNSQKSHGQIQKDIPNTGSKLTKRIRAAEKMESLKSAEKMFDVFLHSQQQILKFENTTRKCVRVKLFSLCDDHGLQFEMLWNGSSRDIVIKKRSVC